MNGAAILDYGQRAIGSIDSRDVFFFWDKVNQAALDFVRETGCLTKDILITTVQNQSEYVLPPDFIRLTLRDRRRRYYAVYTASGNRSAIFATDMEKLEYPESVTITAATPSRFAIMDEQTPPEQVDGAATADGTESGGIIRLTDSNADFETDNIQPRDRISNLDDESMGVVIQRVSATELDIVLFNGSKNRVKTGDVYVISPVPRRVLILDPAPANDDETVLLKYISAPNPVYSAYHSFRIDPQSLHAIAMEAAYLFTSDLNLELPAHMNLHQIYVQEVSRKKKELALNRLQMAPLGGYTIRR